ncbi:heterokaryon incompatibility protein-domain-containing protein [Xylariaceae sp. AK1471]|nr:heterokaryon incompatibility protein-domain-containing protein [Xylariaceae sp. AK1471]
MSNTNFSRKLITRYNTIPLGIFGLSGWRLSIGVWFQLTRDKKVPRIEASTTSGDGVNKYQYRPLHSASKRDRAIRLLQLNPGNAGEPLTARLINTDLVSAHRRYTALSYVWGRAPEYGNEQARIYIDNMYLPIWDNLNMALHHLRSTNLMVTLWVDALCINQADQEEKSSQVALMTDIYGGAEKVHAWLGEASAESLLGIEILSYLIGDGPFDDGAPWNRNPAPEVAKGLRDILDRTYFSRIWIVQEAALGQRVEIQVGNLSVQWSSGLDARRFLMRIKLLEVSPAWGEEQSGYIDFRPLRELLDHSVAMEAQQVGKHPSPTLLNVVHSMRHMHSTDPRDKIFGLLGLVQPAEVAGFVPDYNLTREETYRRFYKFVYHAALRDPNQTLAEHNKAYTGVASVYD